MEVILRKDVQNIGEAGDMVTVKDGYARNFLLPQNFAEIATDGAVKNREQNLNRITITAAVIEKSGKATFEYTQDTPEEEIFPLTAKPARSTSAFAD